MANNSGPADQCDACGIYYAKWLRATLRKPGATAPARVSTRQPASALLEPWCYTPDIVKPLEFGARCALVPVLAVWGYLLIGTDFRITTGLFAEIGFYSPIISGATLLFHEAGHVIFSPLGRFMAVLGGSLMQLLVPAGLTVGFVYYYKNPFAGSVTLWWLGYSCMDLAPYIYDARDMQLLLLGGGTGAETGGHDWNNLLRWMNALDQHERVATFVDTTGELLTIAAVGWAAWLLKLQYARLNTDR